MNHKLQVITLAALAALSAGAAQAQSSTSSSWTNAFSQPIAQPNIFKGGAILYQTH